MLWDDVSLGNIIQHIERIEKEKDELYGHIYMLEYNIGELTGNITYLQDRLRIMEEQTEEKPDATMFINRLAGLCFDIRSLFKEHFENGDIDISEDELMRIISNYTV